MLGGLWSSHERRGCEPTRQNRGQERCSLGPQSLNPRPATPTGLGREVSFLSDVNYYKDSISEFDKSQSSREQT